MTGSEKVNVLPFPTSLSTQSQVVVDGKPRSILGIHFDVDHDRAGRPLGVLEGAVSEGPRLSADRRPPTTSDIK